MFAPHPTSCFNVVVASDGELILLIFNVRLGTLNLLKVNTSPDNTLMYTYDITAIPCVKSRGSFSAKSIFVA